MGAAAVSDEAATCECLLSICFRALNGDVKTGLGVFGRTSLRRSDFRFFGILR